ncbi:protein POLR1D isoform X1 [Ascaphus truei]|uniref:protein POLR1D isoform X1 n=1 Tax=Ascaphus truei TaxID=8439 RepID=UPI003F5AC24F
MQEEEDELERKAVEELLKEAKRGKTRVETMGAMGWMKCPLASTNKRFLVNTIKNTLPPQREKEDGDKNDEEDSEEDHSKEKRHSRKPRTHPYTRNAHSGKEESHSSPESRNSKEKHDKSNTKQR